MASYLSSLSSRERGFLWLALLFIVGIGFYLYVWEPKMAELKTLRSQELPESAQTLAWVKQALNSAYSDQGANKPSKIQGPLLTVLEQTAASVQVRTAIQRIQPDQNGAVKVWLTGVNFDNWLQWLELLKAQGVAVKSTGVIKKSPGIVDVRMTVGRS